MSWFRWDRYREDRPDIPDMLYGYINKDGNLELDLQSRIEDTIPKGKSVNVVYYKRIDTKRLKLTVTQGDV